MSNDWFGCRFATLIWRFENKKNNHLGSFLSGSWKKHYHCFGFSVRILNQQESNITGTPLLQINEGRKRLEPLSHMTGIGDFTSFTILGGMWDYLPLWPWVNISVDLSSSGSCFQLLPITVRTRSLIYTNQRVHELICMCMCAFWRAREHACTLHAFSFTAPPLWNIDPCCSLRSDLLIFLLCVLSLHPEPSTESHVRL